MATEVLLNPNVAPAMARAGFEDIDANESWHQFDVDVFSTRRTAVDAALANLPDGYVASEYRLSFYRFVNDVPSATTYDVTFTASDIADLPGLSSSSVLVTLTPPDSLEPGDSITTSGGTVLGWVLTPPADPGPSKVYLAVGRSADTNFKSIIYVDLPGATGTWGVNWYATFDEAPEPPPPPEPDTVEVLLGENTITPSHWTSLSSSASFARLSTTLGAIPSGSGVVSYRVALHRPTSPGTVYSANVSIEALQELTPIPPLVLGFIGFPDLDPGETSENPQGDKYVLALTPPGDPGPTQVLLALGQSLGERFLSRVWIGLPRELDETWEVRWYGTFLNVESVEVELSSKKGPPLQTFPPTEPPSSQWEGLGREDVPDGKVVQRYHLYIDDQNPNEEIRRAFRFSFDAEQYEALPITETADKIEGDSTFRPGGANRNKAIVLKIPFPYLSGFAVGDEAEVYVIRSGVIATNFVDDMEVAVATTRNWAAQLYASVVTTRTGTRLAPSAEAVQCVGDPALRPWYEPPAEKPTGSATGSDYEAITAKHPLDRTITIIPKAACDFHNPREYLGIHPNLGNLRYFFADRTDVSTLTGLPPPSAASAFDWGDYNANSGTWTDQCTIDPIPLPPKKGETANTQRTGIHSIDEYVAQVPEGAAFVQLLEIAVCDLSGLPAELFGDRSIPGPTVYAVDRVDLPPPDTVGLLRFLDADGNQVGDFFDGCPQGFFQNFPVGTSRSCEYGEAPGGAEFLQVVRSRGYCHSDEPASLWATAPTYALTRTDLPDPTDIGAFRWLDSDGLPIGDVWEVCFVGPPESVCDEEPVVPPPEPPPGPEVERYLLGVPYDHFIETLDLARTGAGDTMGRRQSIARVRVHLLETSALRIGPREGKVQDVPFRQFEPIGASVEPLSGYRRIPIPREWNSNGRMRIEGVDGLRMEVLSLMPDAQIGDE